MKYKKEVEQTMLKLKKEGYEVDLQNMTQDTLESMYIKFVDIYKLTREERILHSAEGNILVKVLEGLGTDIEALEIRSFDEEF